MATQAACFTYPSKTLSPLLFLVTGQWIHPEGKDIFIYRNVCQFALKGSHYTTCTTCIQGPLKKETLAQARCGQVVWVSHGRGVTRGRDKSARTQPGASEMQIWGVGGAKIWLRVKRTNKRKLSIWDLCLWSCLWTVGCLVHCNQWHITQVVSLRRQEHEVSFFRIFFVLTCLGWGCGGKRN